MRWIIPCGALLALLGLTSARASAASPAAAIAGRWVSNCLPLGKSGRHGLIVRLTLSPSAFTASGQMFAHNSCDMPVIVFSDDAVVERADGPPGGLDLHLRFESATMTLADRIVAGIYAQRAKCGSDAWQVDTPVHVEGQVCEPISYPAKGARLVAKTRLRDDRLTIQGLSALFGATGGDGIALPQDVEFRRDQR